MWFLHRPDAANVWKNEAVCNRYLRYKGILDGNKIPRYLITKKLAVDISFEEPLEKLWNAHEQAAIEFKELLMKVDSEKILLNELPSPEKSFLDLKEKITYKILENCHFCERRCGTNRAQGKVGFCRLGMDSYISSAFAHTGEESVLVPSGTIFFTGCTFTCVFCQNSDISQEWGDAVENKVTEGVKVTSKQVALMAEKLWKDGVRNINFVGGDPTPNLHTIISALKHFEKSITILWNSNMYQSLEATKLLLELMDFWLPDFKFWENDFAKKMSGINNYQEIITRNIKLAYDEGSGEILIRHLIMPGRVDQDTFPILDWCAKEVPKALINLMDQYRPEYLVRREPKTYSSINQRITPTEWQKATEKADALGLLWKPVS